MNAFADLNEPQSDPLEASIARHLWRWALATDEERAADDASGLDLPGCIAFYLCGLFHDIKSTRSRGFWCDGVLELSITKIHRRAFLLVGVAYCPDNLAPFELEFHFANRRDFQPLRTIFRFGESNQAGGIRWHTNEHKAAMIVLRRPRCNQDWAVAVELTSTEK